VRTKRARHNRRQDWPRINAHQYRGIRAHSLKIDPKLLVFFSYALSPSAPASFGIHCSQRFGGDSDGVLWRHLPRLLEKMCSAPSVRSNTAPPALLCPITAGGNWTQLRRPSQFCRIATLRRPELLTFPEILIFICKLNEDSEAPFRSFGRSNEFEIFWRVHPIWLLALEVFIGLLGLRA
jgi:hypothetical protein